MKILFRVWLGAVLMLQVAAYAQTLYKWVDAQGNVTYSDRPAPAGQDVKDLSATVNVMGAGQAQVGGLPYELQQTANRNPVALYTAKACPPCDDGRALLRKRGAPYSEKLIESETDLKELTSKFNTQTLPILTVGEKNITGYSSVDWHSALDGAGYPKEIKLPKDLATGKVEKLTQAAGVGANSSSAEVAKSALANTRREVPTVKPNAVQESSAGIKF